MSAFAYDKTTAKTDAAKELQAGDGPDAATGRDPVSLGDFITLAQNASAETIADLLAAAAAGQPHTGRLLAGRGMIKWKGEAVDANAVLSEVNSADLWPTVQQAIVDGHASFNDQAWENLRSTLAGAPSCVDKLVKVLGYEKTIDKGFSAVTKAGILTEMMRLPQADTGYVTGGVKKVTRGAWGYREKGRAVQGKDALSNRAFDAMMKRKDAEVADGDQKAQIQKDIATYLDKQGVDEAVDLVAYSVRHEIGHAMDKKHSGASATLREAAGWKTVTTEEFVKACEPKLTGAALDEAVNALAPVFGGGTAESAGGKGGEDGLNKYQQLEKTLGTWEEGKKNATLTAALRASRVGKSMTRHAVTGGYAQASYIVSSLAIIDKALYERLQAWNNPFAMVSSKEWVAEIYAQAMQPDFDVDGASFFGAAEKAFIKSVKGE